MTKITRLCFIAMIFILNEVTAKTENNSSATFYSAASMTIQRVRIDFTMPNGYVRHLLLGFTSNNIATDGYDYGYDALNIDSFPDDLNWMIEDKRYVIQGVGAFEDTKKYPLGLFLKNEGNIEIALDRTENFESPIDVYLYDSYLDTYTKLNEESFADSLPKGDYVDRFYIAFKSDENSITAGEEDITSQYAKSSLSSEYPDVRNTRISYLKNSNELFIDAQETINITAISFFSVTGQRIFTSNVNSITNQVKIPMHTDGLRYGIVTIETESGSTSMQIVIN